MAAVHSIDRSGHAFRINRRHAVAGAATAVGCAALGQTSAFATTSLGAQMIEAVEDWLATLNGLQRNQALFDFDDRRRRRWSYMWGDRPAPGLRLEDMSAAQEDAAMALLATGLSGYGLETATNIMLQQDILRDEWSKGSADRNRKRFSVMIFGTPSHDTPWAWRWEGHHLTITYTLIGDRIVAHTPKAFSSEPNTVPSGRHKGLVVLPENETLGRALFDALSPANRSVALLRETSFGNILALPGRERDIEDREGVPLGDLPQGQVDIVSRLIELYTSDHLARPLALEQRQRIAHQDLTEVRFGWAGSNTPGETMYYRIHGETFLIEFAVLRNQPQHHHTIVHDLERHLGDHVL